MLIRFRKSGSLLRKAAFLLAFGAMSAQAAVPAGFMLDLDEATGDIGFMLCPGQVGTPAAFDHSGHDDGSAAPESHPPIATVGEVCDFAVAGSAVVGQTTTSGAFRIDTASRLSVAYRIDIPSNATLKVAKSRGPPTRS